MDENHRDRFVDPLLVLLYSGKLPQKEVFASTFALQLVKTIYKCEREYKQENVFVKPNEHSQTCLSYIMARNDGTARAEAKPALTMLSRDGRRQSQNEGEANKKSHFLQESK